MKRILNFLRTIHREAALDSVKNVLAVLGVGTVIGDFASKMPIYFMVPAFIILVGVWYLDYIRHDFQPIRTALEAAGSLREELNQCTSS